LAADLALFFPGLLAIGLNASGSALGSQGTEPEDEGMDLRAPVLPFFRSFARLPLGVLFGLLFTLGTAAAQDIPHSIAETWREPLLPGSLNTLPSGARGSEVSAANQARDLRLPLFRMPTSPLSGPSGFDDLDPPAGAQDQLPASEPDPLSRLQVNFGTDNPYFDIRRPGDPGGVGFYRLQTQLQVVGTSTGGCLLGLGAAAPAGLENDGAPDGPTVVCPNFAWYQNLGEGALLQGFVGKNVRAAGGWTDNLTRNIECGVAVQRPVPTLGGDINRNVYFFLQAFGHSKADNSPDQRQQFLWELLPGVHWRMNDKWWVSSGVILPVGTPRPDAGQLHITCSWQF
jgi:hypothetical protein